MAGGGHGRAAQAQPVLCLNRDAGEQSWIAERSTLLSHNCEFKCPTTYVWCVIEQKKTFLRSLWQHYIRAAPQESFYFWSASCAIKVLSAMLERMQSICPRAVYWRKAAPSPWPHAAQLQKFPLSSGLFWILVQVHKYLFCPLTQTKIICLSVWPLALAGFPLTQEHVGQSSTN